MNPSASFARPLLSLDYCRSSSSTTCRLSIRFCDGLQLIILDDRRHNGPAHFLKVYPHRGTIELQKGRSNFPTLILVSVVNCSFVQRLVGLPGEHIEVRYGQLYANGVRLDEAAGIPPLTYTSTGPLARTSFALRLRCV